MANNSGSRSGGIGFLGLLAILFIGLKLAGVISWNWWWVLAPLWLPASIGGTIALFALGMYYATTSRKGRALNKLERDLREMSRRQS